MESSELASASSWLHWLSVIKYIGGGMVVVGVAAELLGDWFSEPLQKKLDDARKLEIVQITTEGQRLSKEAETAKAAIAEANARAAEAQLALEQFKRPRKLSEDKMPAIADSLRPFSGTRFDAAAIPGDPEAIIFLTFVTALLESAGWKWVDWSPPTGPGPFSQVWIIDGANKPNIGQFGFFDVLIMLNPEHADDFTRPAEALIAALKAEGFAAALEVASNPSIPNKDTMHITVGRKR